jgi:4-hydroxythreonine-4-phosphate dehydrogenase
LTIPSHSRPVVAVTLGDPAGIGPELTAKLLAGSEPSETATVVLVGDPWLWQDGQQIAGVSVETRPIESFGEARKTFSSVPLFLSMDTVEKASVTRGQVGASCGASVLKVLSCCLDAAVGGSIDAICFAPLNKASMKQGGLRFEDELHFFADYLKVEGYCCEFNTLGNLWTSRLSSHIPFQEASRYVTGERIAEAAKLTHRSLQEAGFAMPRIAIAALNPHGGDNGSCGREEIEIMAPAIAALNAEGVHVDGPFPADTIFLKARDGFYDAIVTLYHDQGQIAIKLMGFERGVSVQGGLPIPITTPAHGTAFDIVGQGKARVDATLSAFRLAARMGAARHAVAG